MQAHLLLPGFLFLSSVTYANAEKPALPVARQLVFPVSGKSNIGSYWGDSREGGNRTHEGIDIFAAKGTAVVAVTDGYVLQITNDPLGGKTVTIQSNDYSWRSYYAHLDEQNVTTGQMIKRGQLIGTVGNTGNARTTPSHLHFGIYEPDGAVDPLPYVKTSPRISSPVKSGPVVYKQTRKAEPTIAKSVPRKTKISPAIRTVAASILTGIVTRKIRGILN